MRLYSLTGATALDDPEHGHFEPDGNGGFDFPDDLSDRLHRFHVGGKPAWEDDVERQNRLIQEELERRKDPATLLGAVEQLVRAASGLQGGQPPADTPPPAKRPAKRAASKTTTKPPAE